MMYYEEEILAFIDNAEYFLKKGDVKLAKMYVQMGLDLSDFFGYRKYQSRLDKIYNMLALGETEKAMSELEKIIKKDK